MKKNIFLQSEKVKYNTAIILCGGKGSRLGILGKKLPKTLVKVNNKPILWFIINSLIQNSFNHFFDLKLSAVRSPLYRSRSSRPNTRRKALDEIYLRLWYGK